MISGFKSRDLFFKQAFREVIPTDFFTFFYKICSLIEYKYYINRRSGDTLAP